MARKIKDERPVLFRIFVIVVFIVVVGAFALLKFSDSKEGVSEKRALAECLTQKDVKMYGAYWCPACSSQKKRFGKAFSAVDYVECAVPGRPREMTKVCQDAEITGFPTWIFADGSRLTGETTLQDLAEQGGCEGAYNPAEQMTAPEGVGAAGDEAEESKEAMEEEGEESEMMEDTNGAEAGNGGVEG